MEPKLFAYLSYRDAPAALTWLAGLGFALVRRQDDDVDQVAGRTPVFDPENT